MHFAMNQYGNLHSFQGYETDRDMEFNFEIYHQVKLEDGTVDMSSKYELKSVLPTFAFIHSEMSFALPPLKICKIVKNVKLWI